MGRVRRSITNFLTLVWRNGGLRDESRRGLLRQVRSNDHDADRHRQRTVNRLVGVAPVKPAEFVIVRIGLWTAHADD